MGYPDQRITDFLHRHHVFTLATCRDNKPWCCQCFYVYIDRFCGLAFASDAATRHIIEAAQNEFVAGSIGLETAVVGRIRGIQLEGKLIDPSDDLLHEISAPYMMRFPVALLMKPRLWFIELLTVKMTDNRLGFGKKLYWNAHSVT